MEVEGVEILNGWVFLKRVEGGKSVWAFLSATIQTIEASDIWSNMEEKCRIRSCWILRRLG